MDKHPLLITEVLHNIFGRLNTDALMQCRQVCHLWKEISTHYLLDYMNGTEIKFSSEDTENPERIIKYLEMFEDEDAFRYQTFYFCEADLNSPLITQLLNVIGESIKVLKLFYEDPYVRDESLRRWDSDEEDSDSEMAPRINSKLLYNILFNYCPNLKRLTLGNLPRAIKEGRVCEAEGKELGITHINVRQDYLTLKYGRLLLLDLFKSCPNLADVRLETNYDSYSQDKLMLDTLMESKRMTSLKVLQLNSVDSSSDLTSGFQYSQLGKLIINSADFSGIYGEKFTTLMSNLSCTLHTLNLKIHNLFDRNAFSATFPVMENLKKLNIGILYGPLSRQHSPSSFGEIHYAIQFPNLKKLGLKVNAKNYNLDEWFSPNQNPHNVLEDLELPCAINNPAKLKQIAELFPNVIRLNMAAQNVKTLQEIWTGWPKLEELLLCVNLDFSREDRRQNMGLDSLLTGIPTTLCRNILKENTFADVDLEKVRVAPSISVLKRLKKLYIHSGPNTNTVSGNRHSGDMVTDVSGYLALSKLSSLTSLAVCLGSDAISETCAEYICDQLGLTLKAKCWTSCTKTGMIEKIKPIKWHSTTGRPYSFAD